MRILLDTHAFIFALSSDSGLKGDARELLEDPANSIYFSAVNVWEIEIKVRIGKLERPRADPIAIARRSGWEELPITSRHALALSGLDLIHHDPFDRLLIAQALFEGLTILTRDRVFALYDVPSIEC